MEIRDAALRWWLRRGGVMREPGNALVVQTFHAKARAFVVSGIAERWLTKNKPCSAS